MRSEGSFDLWRIALLCGIDLWFRRAHSMFLFLEAWIEEKRGH